MNACVLDTDVVIAALDRRDVHHEAAAALVLRLVDDETPRLLSTVNYAEALVRPAVDGPTLRRAVDAIAALGIRLVAPSAEIARAAARHRGRGISLADGFAIATAEGGGAALASFDRRVRRAVSALSIELLG
ncbi:PIN domain-containing protein [Conexibacter sp. JD483]|uniref:type II toxin-antitoxin system VapC family toxin n=1 Tax=unclassified Conexibacter TaxID=2627773 RepID=UPI00271F14AA|nr:MULTISPECIES: PIN domain-containing protein [unclassified Conexibacter]MDO8189479.1 PIN domain-containing protein [Conexibacter sp. CPCC 205706]MDO8202069.1 PIN domain-containing protein [Conexibacter sp. CPCC 205762]MDR9372668.1 PIN domain-containing protein [Conexibacter sp. JD483]